MLGLLIYPLIAFSQLSTVNGLSQNTVFSIDSDSQKNMWFATYNGINRFDGYNFSVYHLENDPDFVQVAGADPFVFVDSKDNVWAYDRGLGVLDKCTDDFVLCRGVLSGPVTDIAETINGNILIVTGGRIAEVNAHTKTLVVDNSLYSGNDVSEIHCKNGLLAVGTNDGKILLYRSNDYTLIDEFQVTKGTEERIVDLYIKSSAELWALLSHFGAKRIDISSMSEKSYVSSRKGEGIIADQILEDTKGSLYLLGASAWYKYDNLTDEFELQSDSNFPKQIKGGYFDSDDGIWFGTFRSGVYYAYLNEIPVQTVNLGIPFNELIVCSIAEGSDGKLWISTQENGILIYDIFSGKTTKFASQFEPLKSGVMCTVFDEKSNKIYFGNNCGIIIYDCISRSFETIESFESQQLQVYSIVREDSKRWWVGTLSGLYIFNSDNMSLSKVPSTDNMFIYNLYRDNSGYLWTATMDGLFRATLDYDKDSTPVCGEFVRYSDAKDVHDILKVAQKLYVAARNGLFVLNDSGIIRHYTTSEGLSSNYLNGLEVDSFGRIWIGTEYGLNCLDPTTDKITRIYKADGANVDYYTKNSHCRTSGGRIYFGGDGGVTYVDSNVSQSELCSNMPRIASALINGIEKDVSNGYLKLKHYQNNIRFRFAVPNYSSKGKSVFYYRLVGLDKEWQSTQSEKSVSYSSLTPGTYRFEMYSTNKNSKRSPDILAIDITISNPWYASLVAKLLYLIALISGVVFFIQVQINRNMKKTEAEIEKIKEESKSEIDKLRVHNMIGRPCPPNEVEFLVKMLDVIEANISNSSFSVEKLAAEMCMSRSNLFLRVREAIDDSASHIIRVVRFNKACQLLTETDMTIEEIAQETGYSSGASFSASFKKEKNVSPIEWRK